LISHNSKFPHLELWVQWVLAKLVARCIVHNQCCVKIVCQTYKLPISKAVVIPHGHYRAIYPSKINLKIARQHLNLRQDGKVYLNLGMLKPYKGLETLLQYWQNNPGFRQHNTLLIAGQALDHNYAISLAEKSLGITNVILREMFIEDDELHYYFSAANVVVLPFKSVLTSGSLVLAMSFGKPVIAPRLGGIPETLAGADDLLYNPEDPQGLGKALQKSTEIDLKNLSDRTAQACDRLDWKDIALKTKQVYLT
jgi:glycosyltransferase involved in cell wall biosynthesis